MPAQIARWLWIPPGRARRGGGADFGPGAAAARVGLRGFSGFREYRKKSKQGFQRRGVGMSGPERMRLTWKAPGPVALRFAHSNEFVQILNGPIGSGKTTATMMKFIRLGQAQRPSLLSHHINAEGQPAPLRRFKVCAVRDTYRQLWKTTIPSWNERMPKTTGNWQGGEGAPASHNILFALSDGSFLDFTIEFVAIGDNAVEDVLRGYQVTAFYLNEMDLLAEAVLIYAKSRAGRFPGMDEGGPSWYGIIGDCNAPELDTWLYDNYFLKTPAELREDGVALFRQPSALSPHAENVSNLVPGYYEKQARGQPDWFKKRMLRNEPGYSRSGKPIYGEEFNDLVHVAEEPIAGVQGFGLRIGLDAGLDPSAIFGQKTPSGAWRIIGELVGDHGTGPMRFGKMLAAYLAEHFPGWEGIQAWADPSAFYGADKQDETSQTWVQIVEGQTALRIRPAPTNEPTARWEAVRLPLTRLIDGQPGFQLSPVCKKLRTGFNSAYRFRKKGQGETGVYSEQAEKNDVSHPHDALQYLCSGGGEDAEIRKRVAQDAARRTGQQRRTQDFDPYTGAAL